MTNDNNDKIYQIPLKTFENDAKYLGQWNLETNVRHGQGVQIWPDGSFYEGFWKNDLANGRGRKIYSNGNLYEGYWKDDK